TCATCVLLIQVLLRNSADRKEKQNLQILGQSFHLEIISNNNPKQNKFRPAVAKHQIAQFAKNKTTVTIGLLVKC
ncbi:MAG: hypothetical protein LGB71_05850, partial [Sulfurovum sp.]|nr:hypothetical protein [Sulfurovum sp.]